MTQTRSVHITTRILLATLFIAFPASGLFAQNLLPNGSFDSNTSGWTFFTDRFDFVSDDGTGSSGPGCGELGDTLLNGGTGMARNDTFPTVNPSSDYEFSIDVKLPPGSLAVNAYVGLDWLNSDGSYSGETSEFFLSEDLSDGAWHHFTGQQTSPSFAHGVVFTIGVVTPSSGSGEASLRWDNAVFQATTTALIFSDGFENAGTSAWSSAVP